MMSSSKIPCIYCNKECKSSDSRPYPSSKSKDRIHNKCQIKKTLADKRQPVTETQTHRESPLHDKEVHIMATPATTSLSERMIQEESDIKRVMNEKKMSKLSDGSRKLSETSSQYFFDLKAGIAKPHEKKRYLKHRNLCEIAARYDDNGFSEEAIGRSYDHQGKDLNTIGDSDEECNADSDGYVDEGRSRQTGGIDQRKNCRSEGEGKSSAKKRLKIQVDEKNPCWFCLSSPQVEKHLIIAIGDFCYLTLAKGGLNDDHLLIMPIEHVQCLNDEANTPDLLEELERFKKSLVNYFGAKSLGVVFFERNFRSVHWQLQVVPIPMYIIDTIEDDIKSISKMHFKNSNYLDIIDKCSISDMIPPGVPYLFWAIEPNGSRFVTQIELKGSFFPVQLGRLVLADAKILACKDRIDWKKCIKSKEEYEVLAASMKKAYEPYDIT